jgi:hypothetical protein
MDSAEIAKKMIDTLAHMKHRPHMHVDEEMPAAVAYIDGVHWMLEMFQTLPLQYVRRYTQVVIKRGWVVTAKNPAYQMLERGMSHDEIVQEVVSIELEVWQLVLEDTQD